VTTKKPDNLRVALVSLNPEHLSRETREAYRQGLRVLIATNRVDRPTLPLAVAMIEKLSTVRTSFIPNPSTDSDIFGFLKIKEPAQ